LRPTPLLLLAERPVMTAALGAGAILGGLLLATAGRRNAAAPLLEGAPT
jgi:hypothetical protein